MSKVGLNTPWGIYYSEVEALLGKDPDIKLEYDNDSYTLMIYVNKNRKADALIELLPQEKKFGNVTLKITVIPANFKNDKKIELFRAAFEGNPVFAFTEDGGFGRPHSYVVFRKKVVQFFNDDLGTYSGYYSGLYEDIARDVFGEQEGIRFGTEVDEPED